MQRTYSENVPATIVMKTYMKLKKIKIRNEIRIKRANGKDDTDTESEPEAGKANVRKGNKYLTK